MRTVKAGDLARSNKGRIRGLVRAGSRSDRSPAIQRLSAALSDPTQCLRCGAVFHHKAWHRPPKDWARVAGTRRQDCPACRQAESGEAYGKVLVRGAFARLHENAVRRRIANVAARGAFNQPERRIVAIEPGPGGLEVRTTSQKLAHRLAHELRKAFGGSLTYRWSDRDGSLLATWRSDDSIR
jgi:NMD protein affecting ribosome stability and mRNA decay